MKNQPRNVTTATKNDTTAAANATKPATVITSKTRPATVILRKRKTDKSGATAYAIDGLKCSVYFNKGMFAGDPPETIEIASASITVPGSKPTPEQRKAELAALTPAQRAALKLEAARKALAKLEAAAATTTPQPAATEAKAKS